MVDSGDLAHVAVRFVSLGSLGDVAGRLFGIALRLVVQAKVEVAIELVSSQGGLAGVAGLDGIQYLPFGAFSGEERVDFLKRHAPVGGDFDELFFRRLHAVDF